VSERVSNGVPDHQRQQVAPHCSRRAARSKEEHHDVAPAQGGETHGECGAHAAAEGREGRARGTGATA
jgi:hypothetical protein